MTELELSPLTPKLSNGAERRLAAYLGEIGSLLGDKRRRHSFAMYACGLFVEGERKSAEPWRLG